MEVVKLTLLLLITYCTKCNLISGRGYNNSDRWNKDSGPSRSNNFGQNNNANSNLLSGNRGSGNIGNLNSMGFGNNSIGAGGMRNIPPMMLNENINEQQGGRGGIGSGGMLSNNRSAQAIRAKHPDANDCEIIVVAKPLTYV